AVPVDFALGSVLVEVVVAEAGIDGEMYFVLAASPLVAPAELEELETLFRLRPLAAAVIRHVAGKHDAARDSNPLPGGVQGCRRAVDRRGPARVPDAVQRADVAQQVLVGLALLPAVRAQPVAGAAGM